MPHINLRTYRVPIRNLGDSFNGYRILQLTDLHLGRPVRVEQAIAAAGAHPADLIVLTGDIIHKPHNTELGTEFLNALARNTRPTDGVLGILGNHDAGLVNVLNDSLPVRWLINDALQIARPPSYMNVVGVNQLTWPDTDLTHALACLRTDSPTIVLAHYPATAALVADVADLVIAGHTHAGQIKLPKLPYFTNDYLGWRFGYGSHRIGSATVVVSSGLGYSGPLNLRIFAPPEITVIELIKTPPLPSEV